ncbi:MAG TPA: cytochrome-c peroxidase, partial [Bacteroidetes bacterium]|nr:cytochrome-c peroxidase [Bacteroidota bacterium]
MAPVVAVFLLAGIYWKNAEKTTGAAGSTTALHIPVGFPRPVIPADNQPTPKRIDLGRQLFYDPVLSRDSTISCASCHRQEYAFADNVPLSP